MKETRAEKFLALGLAGAALTVAGEMLGGFTPSTEGMDQMARLFSSVKTLPVWRIGLCSTLGALGILAQFFGFHGLYLTFDNRESRMAKAFFVGNCCFTILGSLVHVLCCMLMYVIKTNFAAAGEFSVWFLAPITVLFYAGYLVFAAVAFWQVFKGHTPFPKTFWVFNPLVGKILINAVTAVLPPSEVVNGIAFSDMGITSVLTFAALLIYYKNKVKSA